MKAHLHNLVFFFTSYIFCESNRFSFVFPLDFFLQKTFTHWIKCCYFSSFFSVCFVLRFAICSLVFVYVITSAINFTQIFAKHLTWIWKCVCFSYWLSWAHTHQNTQNTEKKKKILFGDLGSFSFVMRFIFIFVRWIPF